MPKAFVAYPGKEQIVGSTIREAAELSASEPLQLEPWESLSVIGFKIDNLIRWQLDEVDALVADITYPNNNVFYEMGFAASIGKPIIPIVNLAVEKAVDGIKNIGLFDEMGWLGYSNSNDLVSQLRQWNSVSWKNSFIRNRNHAQPLFILDVAIKTNFRNHIFNAVKDAHLNYRSFDPIEVPRLTASAAISEVSSSAGLILSILQPDIIDSYKNNMRASFLLGLAHGFDLDALTIQFGHGPVPLDYRDFVTNSTHRTETARHVESYCAETLIRNQKRTQSAKKGSQGILSDIYLGSPTAENEIQNLGLYFVETAEFSRAQRAEGAVVVGRKGSGKSAVFLQIVELNSQNKKLCIVDLRPASHNLSELREQLLSVVSEGLFDHTIASFWQYIIYFEIVLKLREQLLTFSKNDYELQKQLIELEEDLNLDEATVSGDFTSRLEEAIKNVIREIENSNSVNNLKDKVTNIMFENKIPKLRDIISKYKSYYDSILILIDDLDKGWPPRRVERHDVATVKHLIEVLNRMQRDLRRKGVEFKHLVFLRSDIYEILVQETSDRGKYNVIKLDWSDPQQLRNLLRKRVASEVDLGSEDDAWAAINPSFGNTDAISMMIESSLRRPRFLIDLAERTLSVAVNRGHLKVTRGDVEEGMRQMSLYLVSDFGYEMRDVAGTPEDLFYSFIGAQDLLTESELSSLLTLKDSSLSLEETIEFLIWYGFLGIVSKDNQQLFIYDTEYDYRRLEAERPKDAQETLYSINPAFIRGLS